MMQDVGKGLGVLWGIVWGACLMNFAMAAPPEAMSGIEIAASADEYLEVPFSISEKTGSNPLFPVSIQQSLTTPGQKTLHYSIDMAALKETLFDESSSGERRTAEPMFRTIIFKITRTKDRIEPGGQVRTNAYWLEKIEIWADPELRNELYVYALPEPEEKHWYSIFKAEPKMIAFVFGSIEVKELIKQSE